MGEVEGNGSAVVQVEGSASRVVEIENSGSAAEEIKGSRFGVSVADSSLVRAKKIFLCLERL